MKYKIISRSKIKDPKATATTINENVSLDDYTIECPPGLYRLFISSNTQEAFNIRIDDDVTQQDNLRMIDRQQILDDIYKKQVGSDFSPLRKLIEDYNEEQILLVYDYEFQYDKNFFVCLNNELKEIIKNVSFYFLL